MKKYLNCFLIVIVGITINACSDPNEPKEQTYTDLMELINSVDVFPPPSPYYRQIDNQLVGDGAKMGAELDTLNDIWYKKNSTPYVFTQRFEATINLNANQSDIYPGSIVQGKDLISGRAVSIGDNFARKPLTITMANGGGSVAIEMPSYANVSDAMNSLVAQKMPIPAVVNYELREMYSAEQALMEFGMDIGWGFLSASGMYTTNTFDTRNSVLLCFKQTYYTMTIGNNRSATDLFENNVDINLLQTKTGTGNPLCVINEVDYGRIIIVKVTSSESYEEITAKIKAGIKFINSGGGSFTTSTSEFNSSYEFKAQVIGGKASDGAKVVDGIDAVFDIIKKGADYADGNPGFPISYRATYLKNNEPVLSGKTTYYNEVITQATKGKFRVTFHKFIMQKIGDLSSIVNPKIYFLGGQPGNSFQLERQFNKTLNIGDTLDISVYRDITLGTKSDISSMFFDIYVFLGFENANFNSLPMEQVIGAGIWRFDDTKSIIEKSKIDGLKFDYFSDFLIQLENYKGEYSSATFHISLELIE